MNELKDNPRKVNLWQLLSTTTGYSKVYCRKVIQGERNKDSKGGQKIVNKYNELSKILSND
jgi:hypothetical protein